MRELVFIAESTKQTWPVDMAQCLRQALKEVKQGEGRALGADRIEHHQDRYQAILKTGLAQNPITPPTGRRGRTKQTPATNLVCRLRDHRDDVLRFLTDPRVPFDNNEAERAIRMPKLKQKIGGCFRTTEGVDTFCTIRSYLATLKKQGHNLFDALVRSCQGNPPDPCASAQS
jgi:transposase